MRAWIACTPGRPWAFSRRATTTPFPSLRALQGGLAEMMARARGDVIPELKAIQLVPIGLGLRTLLGLAAALPRPRSARPFPLPICFKRTAPIDKPALHPRVKSSEAFKRIMVDLQPEDAQPHLHPALRAHRTTEMTQDAWTPFTHTAHGLGEAMDGGRGLEPARQRHPCPMA